MDIKICRSFNAFLFFQEVEKVSSCDYDHVDKEFMKKSKEKMMKHMIFAALQGKKNPTTDQASVEAFLDQVLKAKEMKIDK